MWLNKKPVPHANRSPKHIVITNKSAENLLKDFINFCTAVYTRFPEIILLYRESSFISNEFRKSAKNLGIQLQFSGIEAHNPIGQEERDYHTLRRIFNVI